METSGFEPEPFFWRKINRSCCPNLIQDYRFGNATITPRFLCFFKVSLRFFRVSDLSLEKIEMLRDLCLLDGCFSYKMGKIAEPSIVCIIS